MYNNKKPAREYIQRLYLKSNFTQGPLQNHPGIEELIGAFEKNIWKKSTPIEPGQAQNKANSDKKCYKR